MGREKKLLGSSMWLRCSLALAWIFHFLLLLAHASAFNRTIEEEFAPTTTSRRLLTIGSPSNNRQFHLPRFEEFHKSGSYSIAISFSFGPLQTWTDTYLWTVAQQVVVNLLDLDKETTDRQTKRQRTNLDTPESSNTAAGRTDKSELLLLIEKATGLDLPKMAPTDNDFRELKNKFNKLTAELNQERILNGFCYGKLAEIADKLSPQEFETVPDIPDTTLKQRIEISFENADAALPENQKKTDQTFRVLPLLTDVLAKPGNTRDQSKVTAAINVWLGEKVLDSESRQPLENIGPTNYEYALALCQTVQQSKFVTEFRKMKDVVTSLLEQKLSREDYEALLKATNQQHPDLLHPNKGKGKNVDLYVKEAEEWKNKLVTLVNNVLSPDQQTLYWKKMFLGMEEMKTQQLDWDITKGSEPGVLFPNSGCSVVNNENSVFSDEPADYPSLGDASQFVLGENYPLSSVTNEHGKRTYTVFSREGGETS